MSVLDLHSMLTKVNLTAQAELLWNKAVELAANIDVDICDAIRLISSAKLRTDIFQGMCV